MAGDLGELGDQALGRGAVKPMDTQWPGRGCRRDRDVREAEQLLQRPAFGVDGLDPRDGSDPSLLAEPAGLGVDGGVGDLPAMNAVTPARHDNEVRRREQDSQDKSSDPQTGLVPRAQ